MEDKEDTIYIVIRGTNSQQVWFVAVLYDACLEWISVSGMAKADD